MEYMCYEIPPEMCKPRRHSSSYTVKSEAESRAEVNSSKSKPEVRSEEDPKGQQGCSEISAQEELVTDPTGRSFYLPSALLLLWFY